MGLCWACSRSRPRRWRGRGSPIGGRTWPGGPLWPSTRCSSVSRPASSLFAASPMPGSAPLPLCSPPPSFCSCARPSTAETAAQAPHASEAISRALIPFVDEGLTKDASAEHTAGGAAEGGNGQSSLSLLRPFSHFLLLLFYPSAYMVAAQLASRSPLPHSLSNALLEGASKCPHPSLRRAPFRCSASCNPPLRRSVAQAAPSFPSCRVCKKQARSHPPRRPAPGALASLPG